jgi:hypothetical protein
VFRSLTKRNSNIPHDTPPEPQELNSSKENARFTKNQFLRNKPRTESKTPENEPRTNPEIGHPTSAVTASTWTVNNQYGRKETFPDLGLR